VEVWWILYVRTNIQSVPKHDTPLINSKLLINDTGKRWPDDLRAARVQCIVCISTVIYVPCVIVLVGTL